MAKTSKKHLELSENILWMNSPGEGRRMDKKGIIMFQVSFKEGETHERLQVRGPCTVYACFFSWLSIFAPVHLSTQMVFWVYLPLRISSHPCSIQNKRNLKNSPGS